MVTGSEFPWKKNRFPSIFGMLQAMPEAVRLQPPSLSEPEWRLYGIGSSDMFMPSWVVKAQGSMLEFSVSFRGIEISEQRTFLYISRTLSLVERLFCLLDIGYSREVILSWSVGAHDVSLYPTVYINMVGQIVDVSFPNI